MVLTYTGTKGEPVATPSGAAPTFAADLTEIADWIQSGRSFRKLATQAALIAATGMDDNDLAQVDNIDGAWFKYDSALPGWRMYGIPVFDTASARTTAISTPADNMLSIRRDGDYIEQYISAAWRPIDIPRFADAAARTAAVTSPVLGMRTVLTSDEVIYRYDGSTHQPWESDWLASGSTGLGTVTLANVTLGTGGTAVMEAKYINGRLLFRYRITLGSSGFAVSGIPNFTFPFNLRAPGGGTTVLGNFPGFGTAIDVSAGAAGAPNFHRNNDAAVAGFVTKVYVISNIGAAINISATVPFTWAAGDVLTGEVWLDRS